MCDHKKAAKRAILFAVMNSEASIITSDSEGAHCVHPHIHKQPSRCFRYLQGLEPWHALKWQTNMLKSLHDHFFMVDNKEPFEYDEFLYIASAQQLGWPVMVYVCVFVSVSMSLQCNTGCLAKRKCQAGDAWLIRYHGRIMYEKSSWKESEQAAIVLSLLFFLSLLAATPPPPLLFFPHCQFLFVCTCLGIFRLPGHIMPCFLMQRCHSLGLYSLFINGLLDLTCCVFRVACFCGSLPQLTGCQSW